jgi:hypothetical protein
MPTEPHPGILKREFPRVVARNHFDFSDQILTELVNYSTNVLVRCERSSSGGIDESVAVFSTFRAAISIADSIQVLLSQGCIEPSNIILRSLFEHLLNLEYLLEDNAAFSKRSLSWSAFRLYDRIRYLEQLIPESKSGKQFLELKDSDTIAKDVSFVEEAEDAERKIKRYQSVLNKPHFEEIVKEYKLGRKVVGKNRTVKFRFWYQMFGGPQNIREMAIRLNRGAIYSLLYSGWSRFTHGTEKLPYRIVNGEPVFAPLRFPENFGEVVSLTTTFMTAMIYSLHQMYRPEDRAWAHWYQEEIADKLKAVGL